MESADKPIRLVVVDDHAMFRDGLISLLGLERDFEVVGIAADGRQAVEMCRQQNPDILLVDLAMPDWDGLEVIRRVREAGTCRHAVLLSMHRHASVAADARRVGASGYILKEEAFEELADVLRAVMEDDSFIEPMGLLKPVIAPPSLSHREKSVLRYLVQGMTNKEVAAQLSLSVKTIETFRTRMMKKTGARNTADLVRYAVETGLL
jgi:two-component system, NarL family, response regulator NreC